MKKHDNLETLDLDQLATVTGGGWKDLVKKAAFYSSPVAMGAKALYDHGYKTGSSCP